nr:Os02g0103850 [Ipomoea trifida]
MNSRHHSLQPTEIDVRSFIQQFEDLITVFLDFVLNIHLASSLVLLLPAKSTIVPEIIWIIILEMFGELLIVQKTVLVGHPKEEPSKAIELECWDRFHKHTAKVPSEGSHTSASCNHNVCSIQAEGLANG